MRSYEIKNKIVKLLSCFIPNKDKRCDFRDTYSVGKYELDRKHHKIGEYSYMSMNSAIVSPDSTIGKFTSIGREVLKVHLLTLSIDLQLIRLLIPINVNACTVI